MPDHLNSPAVMNSVHLIKNRQSHLFPILPVKFYNGIQQNGLKSRVRFSFAH